MPSVMIPFDGKATRRLGIALTLGLFVAGGYLPPGHYHPSSRAHGALMHRHLAPHAIRYTGQPSLADDDGHIAWSNGSFLTSVSETRGAGPRSALFLRQYSQPRPARFLAVALPSSSRSAHDPPWCSPGWRAPPAPSLS